MEKIAQTPREYRRRITNVAPSGWANSRPMTKPSCRTPVNQSGYLAWIRSRPWVKKAAMWCDIVRTAGRVVISRPRSAAIQPASAPPNVDMWAKPSASIQAAARSVARTAAIGYMPPDRPLPVTSRSGATPCLVMPQSSPVRISPVWTSSAMYRVPWRSQRSLTARR